MVIANGIRSAAKVASHAESPHTNTLKAAAEAKSNNTLSSTERLTLTQMQILHACVRTEYQALEGPWVEYFMTMKDYIIIGLCDVNCAPHAVGILTNFIFNSILAENILRESRFIAILRLLYPLGTNIPMSSEASAALTKCQGIAESFFAELFAAGKPYDAAVHTLISQFAKNYPTQFEKASEMQKLLKEITAKLR